MLEEENLPHPRCARCDMQVPRKALNGRHLGIMECTKGAERNRRRMAETETKENLERAFRGGDGVQVPRAAIYGDGRRLASGGWEYPEGAEKLGEAG